MKSLLIKRKSSSERVNLQGMDSSEEPSICNSNDGDDVAVDSAQQFDGVDTPADRVVLADVATVQQTTLTNSARASLLVEEDLVQFHPKTKAFTVRSLDHYLVHAVHMNDPKRLFRCSCPSQL